MMTLTGPTFPGLYRPGLIEGRAAQNPYMSAGERFRGFTAPASLKGGRAHPLPAPAGGFRGFTAPASLKAPRSRSSRGAARRFRGFTAPASLKARPGPGHRRRLAGFRGFTAPASLKADDHVLPPGLEWFPGLYRPGLIEGWRGPWRGRGRSRRFRGFTAPASLKAMGLRPGGTLAGVSGALPPRPH